MVLEQESATVTRTPAQEIEGFIEYCETVSGLPGSIDVPLFKALAGAYLQGRNYDIQGTKWHDQIVNAQALQRQQQGMTDDSGNGGVVPTSDEVQAEARKRKKETL